MNDKRTIRYSWFAKLKAWFTGVPCGYVKIKDDIDKESVLFWLKHNIEAKPKEGIR
jgi:hypothetical protein